jgi:plasmid stability protein
MTELRIRNVDEWIVDQHRTNAKQRGTSLELELKRILAEAAFSKRQRIADEIEQHLRSVQAKYGTLPSSVEALRDLRDGRV